MISILINILEALLLFAFSNGIYRIYNKGLSHKSRGQQLRRYLIASLVTMIPYYFVGSYWSAAMLTTLFVAVMWICTYNILYDKTYKKSSPDYDNRMDIAFGIYLFGWLSAIAILISPLGIVATIAMTILEMALVILPLAQIGYYLTYDTCIDHNGMQVIKETNYNEIIEYPKSLGFWKMLLITIVILLVTAGIAIGNSFIADYNIWNFDNPLSIVALGAIIIFFGAISRMLWKGGDVWARSHGLFVRTGIAMLYREVKEYMEGNKKYKENVEKRMAKISVDMSRNTLPKPHTIVMVIGESCCRDYMSIYADQEGRETTPWQSEMKKDKEHFFIFKNAYSCGIQTVPSLEKALTEYNQYNDKSFIDSASIVDMAHKAGYRVHWYSNQGHLGSADTPVTLVAETSDVAKWTNQKLGKMQYDEALLDFLGEVDGNVNNLLVLHLKGNHFNFANRYTPEYAAANNLPDGDDVTTYRNSIHYNDHILHSFYNYATKHLNLAAMVYFSDHAAVPDKQRSIQFQNFGMTRIPLWIYLTDTYEKARPEVKAALEENKAKYFTNDLAYEMMCELMGITSDHYDPTNSIASKEYKYTRDMLVTCDGKIKIADDKQ